MKQQKRNLLQRSLIIKLGFMLAWPIAMLSKFVPKKDIALFSSRSGYQIADNAKYLYQNYNGNKIWITKNKALVDTQQQIIYAYSLAGIYYQLIAKHVYFTHGIYDFVPFLIWGSNKINLWHGVPLKEIGPKADDIASPQYKIKIKRLFYFIFPYMYYMACDKVICPDEKRTSDYQRYFSVAKPELIFSKQPRNQYAIQHQKQKKILISPTYRKWDTLFINKYLASLCSQDLAQLLSEKGYSLVLRPHPLDVPFIHQHALPDYVQLDTTIDLYESITGYDLVITDYSSIYYDCMELAIPCYIFAPDLALYQQQVGLGTVYFTEIQHKLISKIEDVIN